MAAITSVGLLGLVLWQIEWGAFTDLIAGVPTWVFVAALAGLLGEGLFTALRMQPFAAQPVSLAVCLRVTGWYVMWLVVLPARLGEVAAISLMRTHLGLRAGSATTGLVLQRVFDLLLLCGAFLVLIAMHATPLSETAVALLMGAVFALLVAAIRWLPTLLALVSRLGSRSSGWRRTLLRFALGARLYYRHRVSGTLLVRVSLLTLGKWTCHLGAFALLLSHLMDLPLHSTILLGAAYNSLAVVPLQTIGGVGVSEAGLLGLLTLFGQELALAAGVAVALRVILISAPLLFWLLAVTLFREKR